MSNKYFRDVMFADTSIAELGRDGHIYRFTEEDGTAILQGYPRDQYGWYFNNTKDRLCAEYDHNGFISINPSIVASHKGLPVLFDD